jgi:hypothetical protein
MTFTLNIFPSSFSVVLSRSALGRGITRTRPLAHAPLLFPPHPLSFGGAALELTQPSPLGLPTDTSCTALSALDTRYATTISTQRDLTPSHPLLVQTLTPQCALQFPSHEGGTAWIGQDTLTMNLDDVDTGVSAEIRVDLSDR